MAKTVGIFIYRTWTTCTEEKDRGFAYYVDCYTAIGIKQWRPGLAEGEADDSDGTQSQELVIWGGILKIH